MRQRCIVFAPPKPPNKGTGEFAMPRVIVWVGYSRGSEAFRRNVSG